MGLNTGVISGVTVISMVTPVPHCPASGVKVYVVVPGIAVLMTAGLHVPVMGGMLVMGIGWLVWLFISPRFEASNAATRTA